MKRMMAMLMCILHLAVMLRYSVMLTPVGVASIVINTVLSRIISGKRINITRVQMRDAGKLSGATVEGIEMIGTIRASGAENGFFREVGGLSGQREPAGGTLCQAQSVLWPDSADRLHPDAHPAGWKGSAG